MNNEEQRSEKPTAPKERRVRPMTPFHWALLRALQVFANTARPSFEEMARKLCIGDSGPLEDAWRDLIGFHAVDRGDFAEAGLTLEGETALREGCFPLGEDPGQATGLVRAAGALQRHEAKPHDGGRDKRTKK